jgi:sec-independent protein translocase protein TatA
MPFNLGAPELIIVLVIIMLVFGVGKLPEVGGAIGKGIREFRKASNDDLASAEGDRTQAREPRADASRKELPADVHEVRAEAHEKSEV